MKIERDLLSLSHRHPLHHCLPLSNTANINYSLIDKFQPTFHTPLASIIHYYKNISHKQSSCPQNLLYFFYLSISEERQAEFLLKSSPTEEWSPFSLSLSLSPITNYFPRCWETERERGKKKRNTVDTSPVRNIVCRR